VADGPTQSISLEGLGSRRISPCHRCAPEPRPAGAPGESRATRTGPNRLQPIMTLWRLEGTGHEPKAPPQRKVRWRKVDAAIARPRSSEAAVLNSLSCPDAQRGYGHAIDEFVEWYCSEPQLSFSKKHSHLLARDKRQHLDIWKAQARSGRITRDWEKGLRAPSAVSLNGMTTIPNNGT
jgi:hypothetical protein